MQLSYRVIPIHNVQSIQSIYFVIVIYNIIISVNREIPYQGQNSGVIEVAKDWKDVLSVCLQYADFLFGQLFSEVTFTVVNEYDSRHAANLGQRSNLKVIRVTKWQNDFYCIFLFWAQTNGLFRLNTDLEGNFYKVDALHLKPSSI